MVDKIFYPGTNQNRASIKKNNNNFTFIYINPNLVDIFDLNVTFRIANKEAVINHNT